MAAAAAAAGAPSAAASTQATGQDRTNALHAVALRGSVPHWSAAAASFFSPSFRPRHCRFRSAPAPAAAACARRSRASAKSREKLLLEAEPRDPWLDSLSLLAAEDIAAADAVPSGWAIGVDPDTGGAIAVLLPNGSSQVFDNPFVRIVVSGVTRKRLDPKSIIQLLRSLHAPPGTTAYIEKSSPFPTDGKLGWWSTGFSYGLWIAALVASGFSVVPVASQTWKAYFGLSRSESPKDDSRQAASILFPDKALSLKLKKHHGMNQLKCKSSFQPVFTCQWASRGSSVGGLWERPCDTNSQWNCRDNGHGHNVDNDSTPLLMIDFYLYMYMLAEGRGGDQVSSRADRSEM